MSDQANAVTLNELAGSLGDGDTEDLEDQGAGATTDDDGAPQVDGEDNQGQVDATDGAGEDAGAAEGAGQEPQKFRVVVKNEQGQDEEKDLTLEELAQGYMLQADYTRKTQAASQERQHLQQQFAQEVTNTHQQAVDAIGQLQQMVLAYVAPELQNVDWMKLATQDQAEFVRLQAVQQQLQGVLQSLDSQRQQHQLQAQQAEQRQREQAIQHSAQYLKTAITGFNGQIYRDTLAGGEKHYGFTPQELASVVDGRMVHVLHDALQWRALQQKKPAVMKKVAEAPKVVKPAAPQPKNRDQEALKRLQKTGSYKDLAKLL